MHRTYTQLIFFSISLISIIVSCNKCQSRTERQQWSPQLESQIYDVLYAQSANLTTNETAKKEYANCCLSKMKEIFPNGLDNPSTGLKDSLKIVALKMGIECAKSLEKYVNIWTPENRKQLELQLYSMEECKSLPKKLRKEYVECVAFELTSRFPTGLGDSNQTAVKKFMIKARKDCVVMISNKYTKMRQLK